MITTENVYYISTALESVFGDEFGNLAPKHMWAVADDFHKANQEEGINATEYKARIWTGNLFSYAKTLVA